MLTVSNTDIDKRLDKTYTAPSIFDMEQYNGRRKSPSTITR